MPVTPSQAAEQAVANNWLTIIARGSMILCAATLPLLWGWASSIDKMLADHETTLQLIQERSKGREAAVANLRSDMITMGSRVTILEIAGTRSEVQQQAVQDDIREILDRIKRIEEGLGRRGEIPWPHERADAR